MVPQLPLLDAGFAASLQAGAVLAAVSADGREARRGTGQRARLAAAAWQGRVRWALHAKDRAWVASRFALPLEDTPHAGRVHRVGLRYYALTQRCMAVESHAVARDAVPVVFESAPPPERVIYAFVHSPAMWICLYGFANARMRISPVVADWFWEDPLHGARVAAITSRGGAAIPAEDGFSRVLEVAAAGGNPALAVDVSGRTPVRFLQKDARVRSGIARLAQLTGAPVVPFRGDVRRGRPVVVVGAPIAARDDVDGMLRDIVAAVEAPLLCRPELWMPYTADMWPDRCEAYRDAYAEDQPAGEVGFTA